MDPAILKTLHIAAAFGLFASLGSTLLAGSRQKAASILHGVSLVLILLVGVASRLGERWFGVTPSDLR